jgi:heme exporter protein A
MLRLENVTKTYGPVRALVGVSCSFGDGAVSVVRGPNGSGKSTLLSLLGTLARPTSGRVSHGHLGATRGEVRTTLGWVGHESLCYPDLTGRQNIELAARLQERDPSAAYERACERFDLKAFVNRPVRTYSRGQRQRVAVARALVHDPGLLLLDEPTSGLDAGSIERLAVILRAEAARGATVILVTHDGEFARSLADATVTLERGRVVANA